MIPIPDVDRGRGDHRQLLGVVMFEEGGFYKLGTRHGVLNCAYTRNQFSSCENNFLSVEDVPDEEIPLRTAANLSSIGSGQGFFKCFCKGKCNSNKCKCKKAGVQCNSKCHNSGPCDNK